LDREKVQARLNIEHLAKLRAATGVPLVLHGGSGIQKASIQAGIANGISKINIGTDIRQVYEQARRAGEAVSGAQERVYARACQLIADALEIEGSRDVINPA
jgi:fructose/tagatose bisphosphate aldolase